MRFLFLLFACHGISNKPTSVPKIVWLLRFTQTIPTGEVLGILGKIAKVEESPAVITSMRTSMYQKVVWFTKCFSFHGNPTTSSTGPEPRFLLLIHYIMLPPVTSLMWKMSQELARSSEISFLLFQDMFHLVIEGQCAFVKLLNTFLWN